MSSKKDFLYDIGFLFKWGRKIEDISTKFAFFCQQHQNALFFQSFQYFLVNHKPCFKKTQDIKKSFMRWTQFFWFDICMCWQKKITTAISDWFRASTDSFIGMVLFPLLSGYSLILRKKTQDIKKRVLFSLNHFSRFHECMYYKKWLQRSVTDIAFHMTTFCKYT